MTLEVPWDESHKAVGRAGWKYPVSRADVAASLSAAGAHVSSLSWSTVSDPLSLPDLPLLTVYVSGDSRPGYFRPRRSGPRTGWVRLTLYAVPFDRAEEAAELLDESALADAAEWIAGIQSRGNAWTASDHNLSFELSGAGMRRSEE